MIFLSAESLSIIIDMRLNSGPCKQSGTMHLMLLDAQFGDFKYLIFLSFGNFNPKVTQTSLTYSS